MGCSSAVAACGAGAVCAGAVAVACDVAGGSPGAMEGIRDRFVGVRLKDGRVDRYGIC